MPTGGGIDSAASSRPASLAADVAAALAANPVLLAPMAGITEAPFRGICKRLGAGLTYTEMVSATGLHHHPDAPAAQRLLALDPDEPTAAVQLFGASPSLMAEAVELVIGRLGERVALIDINMGCPVNKVVAKGEGSGLMRTPELAADVVTAAVSAARGVPVSVKIRSGFEDGEVTAPKFAARMEAAGASAVAIHPRTRSQFYRGRSDWDVIAAVKQAVSVPVIGSGDVMSAADVVAMLERTGADAVMVARGAQGNPWIFREARALLAGEPLPEPPTPFDRIDMAREHMRLLIEFDGDHAFSRMRKHVAWYSAGMPGASHVRARVNSCASAAQIDTMLVEYGDWLRNTVGL